MSCKKGKSAGASVHVPDFRKNACVWEALSTRLDTWDLDDTAQVKPEFISRFFAAVKHNPRLLQFTTIVLLFQILRSLLRRRKNEFDETQRQQLTDKSSFCRWCILLTNSGVCCLFCVFKHQINQILEAIFSFPLQVLRRSTAVVPNFYFICFNFSFSYLTETAN